MIQQNIILLINHAIHDLKSLKVAGCIIFINLSILNLLRQLPFTLSRLVRVLQFQPVLVHWEAHGFYTLVMEGQTSLDTFMESLGRFSCGIDITSLLGLHVTFLMINRCLNHPISDSLCNDILGRLLTFEAQSYANISKGNARVREGEATDACAN